jgi:hypothetical protein
MPPLVRSKNKKMKNKNSKKITILENQPPILHFDLPTGTKVGTLPMEPIEKLFAQKEQQ